jgi:hypothetical protein
VSGKDSLSNTTIYGDYANGPFSSFSITKQWSMSHSIIVISIMCLWASCSFKNKLTIFLF